MFYKTCKNKEIIKKIHMKVYFFVTFKIYPTQNQRK